MRKISLKSKSTINGKIEAVRPGTKLAKVVELLIRPQGCTLADAQKATAWPLVSVLQMANAAGLKIKKEKHGRVTRYHAV